MQTHEHVVPKDSYRFHTMCGKFTAELLRSEIIVPIHVSKTDGVLPDNFTLDSQRFIELAQARAASMVDTNNRVIHERVAREVVTGVISDWIAEGILSSNIVDALYYYFLPDRVVSDSYSHAIIPQTIDARMNISLTDHTKNQLRVGEIARNTGIILSDEELLYVCRRKTAAHELGHLIRFLFVILQSQESLDAYDQQSASFSRIHMDTVKQNNDFVNYDIYEQFSLSDRSESLVSGNSMLAAGTSDERIGRGFEYMQMRHDFSRMHISEDAIEDFMREYLLYHKKTEDDVVHIAGLLRVIGIDPSIFMRSVSDLFILLTKNGIPPRIAQNMVGVDATLLGYSNGLTLDQLQDWLEMMESQHLNN